MATSSKPHLPGEIVEKILWEIPDDDIVTFRATSLVCRAWVDPSRIALFDRITIPSDTSQNPLWLARLVYLTLNSHLAAYVNKLYIWDMHTNEIDLATSLIGVLSHVSLLYLEFDGTIDQQRHACNLITRILPTQQNWDDVRVSCTDDSDDGALPPALPWPRTKLSIPYEMRSLDISSSNVAFPQSMLQFVLDTATVETMEDLLVDLNYAFAIDVSTLPQLNALISEFMDLEFLNLSYSAFGPPASDYEPGRIIPDSPLRLDHLVTFTIGCFIDDSTHNLLYSLFGQSHLPALEAIYVQAHATLDSSFPGIALSQKTINLIPFGTESLEGNLYPALLSEDIQQNIKLVDIVISHLPQPQPVLTHGLEVFKQMFGAAHQPRGVVSVRVREVQPRRY